MHRGKTAFDGARNTIEGLTQIPYAEGPELMSTFIPSSVNDKSRDYVGGPVDVDSALFSEAVAPISLGGLLGSAGPRLRDHYECLIIPVSSW